MRILTRTQYDAICDIVTDKDNKIKELESKLQKKQEVIDYLNDKLFKRTEQLMKFQGYCKSQGFSFPVNPRTQIFDLDIPKDTETALVVFSTTV